MNCILILLNTIILSVGQKAIINHRFELQLEREDEFLKNIPKGISWEIPSKNWFQEDFEETCMVNYDEYLNLRKMYFENQDVEINCLFVPILKSDVQNPAKPIHFLSKNLQEHKGITVDLVHCPCITELVMKKNPRQNTTLDKTDLYLAKKLNEDTYFHLKLVNEDKLTAHYVIIDYCEFSDTTILDIEN